MVHTGSNWSYPLLGCTLPLLGMQPLGITATEKQARWLVFKEDTERQPCFFETIFHIGTKNIWKESVWMSKTGTKWSCRLWIMKQQGWCGQFYQHFSCIKWQIQDGSLLNRPNGHHALLKLQFTLIPPVILKSFEEFRLCPPHFFSTWGLKDHISPTTQ